MVCSDDLFAMHHTFPYFIHGARAHTRAFFVFLNCTKESPAHAIVPMRTSPPATYTPACPHARDLRACARTYNHARPRAPRHASLQCL